MKIIITESQYNLLFENKGVDAAQTLIDMAVDDYIESCGKMKAYTNIQLAVCKGLKNKTVKLEVTKVSDFNIGDQKNFRIHLNLFVNQEWMLEDSYYESFENTLAIKISNILGVMRYFCYIDDIKMIDNKDNLTEEQFKLLQETDNDFNKTKTLVTDMWANGMEIKDIVMFTSLSYEQVLFLLKDSDMEIDCEGAEEIIKMIFLHTDLIQKKIHKDDFELIFSYDNFSGAVQFQYINNGFCLEGMATPYWNGECFTPVDGSYAYYEDGRGDYDKYDGLGLRFSNPEYFHSIGELIDWFNSEYIKNLLEKIEILVDDYKYEINQK